LTCEAYFEIAKNAHQPFEVETKGTTVQVLGTQFNINAYPEEEAIRTTLVEGGVRVVAGREKRELLPGQQAVVTRKVAQDETLTVQKEIDLPGVTAWKEGYFVFHNENIQTIMRQVSRWYDVEVSYTGTLPTELFNGKVPRKEPVSKLFHLLELTGQLHFTIHGKKITVGP
jgi:ferric-dicitrate binding protein FerR (iron transport regulator)